jgi:hypothetical protein
VNRLADSIDAIKGNTEMSIDASKELGREINIEETKYMLLVFPRIEFKIMITHSKNC